VGITSAKVHGFAPKSCSFHPAILFINTIKLDKHSKPIKYSLLKSNNPTEKGFYEDKIEFSI
jgi:hypothetical protein